MYDMREVWTFFAFPLNLLLLILWIAGLWALWRHRPHSAIARFLLSPTATASSLLLLIASCLWIGISGDRQFVQSVFFVLVLIYAESVLMMVVLRGWKRPGAHLNLRNIRWRFLLIHLGLMIAVGAGMLGSADSWEARVKLHIGETSREVYLENGRCRVLPYELQLIDFHTEIAHDGVASHYEANIVVAPVDYLKDFTSPSGVQKNSYPDSTSNVCSYGSLYKLSVNHPCTPRFGENIYLSSISDDYCVLQVVHEPWRHIMLAGIIMLIIGAFMLFIKGPGR